MIHTDISEQMTEIKLAASCGSSVSSLYRRYYFVKVSRNVKTYLFGEEITVCCFMIILIIFSYGNDAFLLFFWCLPFVTEYCNGGGIVP